MVKKSRNSATSVKARNWMSFGILILAVIVINVFSDMSYSRLDLTKEKRYTLSEATKNLCSELDEVVYIQVFLDGDFPAEYRRLKNATRDILNEFRVVCDGNMEFRFEDLLADKEIKEKDDILRQLSTKGLMITQPEVSTDEIAGERFIIPGALVNYKGKEYALNFFKREFGKPLEEEINGSIELLEYEIGNVIRKCVANRDRKVAFTTGHGELEDVEVADIAKALEEYYIVERVNINLMDTNAAKPHLAAMFDYPERSGEILFKGIMNNLKEYEALIIAKPRTYFLEEELFLIDQYAMNGGKLIWLVESLIAEMDSVAKYGSIMTADYNLNLNDMLFRYGVRINPNLIQDLNSHGIPVLAKNGGSKPGFLPWLFYPLFAPESEHPIVRNLTSIWGRFVSTIDTLPNRELNKTILLRSSEVSRTASNPVNVSMNLLNVKHDPSVFRKPFQTAAVLVEGKFKSPFAHRPAMKNRSPIPFVESSEKNSMIFISDGDLIRNQISKSQGQIYPLGYDKFASQTFGQPVQFANKKFFLNCVDYLCDESNLIEVRSKKIVLRLLDKVKVKEEKTKWQVINMVLPIVLILIFGLINSAIRRYKYRKA